MHDLKAIFIGGLLIIMTGCASTFTRDTVIAPQATLQRSGSVLIATPENGSYGGYIYEGSGTATANAVRAAFSRFSNQVQVSRHCSQLQCLITNSPVFDYYAVPTILHWEDRATEWSGKVDKIEVKVVVYDRNQKVLTSQLIHGKSKWATFGGDHPQDLLPGAVNPYIESLY